MLLAASHTKSFNFKMSASRSRLLLVRSGILAYCKRCVVEPHHSLTSSSRRCHTMMLGSTPPVKHTIVKNRSLLSNQRRYSVDQRAVSHDTQSAEGASSLITEEDILTMRNKALLSEDYFGVGDLFTVADLFKARVHLGHKEGLRHLHMTPYIYGNRLGQDIIDLDQTAEHLRLALNVLAHIAYRQGISLFVCRNRRNAIKVEETAVACGEFAHCREWRLGLFTNSTFMYRSTTRLPDVCIFLGTLDNVFAQHKAVHEAAKMQVVSIGVVDTNCDPRIVAYPIPGNDDSPSAVHLYCDLFKKAILMGKEKWKQDEKHLE